MPGRGKRNYAAPKFDQPGTPVVITFSTPTVLSDPPPPTPSPLPLLPLWSPGVP